MINVRVTKNEFAAIGRSLAPGIAAHVQATGARVAKSASQRSRRGATGDLAEGWKSRHAGPFRCEIVNGTFYWRFHENGTHKMSAHPMAAPAIEAERNAFYGGLGRIMVSGGIGLSVI